MIKELEEMDVQGTMKYYRGILDSIRVIGKTNMPRNKTQVRQNDKKPDKNKEEKSVPKHKSREEGLHHRFMDLSLYLNEYQQKLCYDSSGLLPNDKKLKKG